jgi:hypothetical protein
VDEKLPRKDIEFPLINSLSYIGACLEKPSWNLNVRRKCIESLRVIRAYAQHLAVRDLKWDLPQVIPKWLIKLERVLRRHSERD